MDLAITPLPCGFGARVETDIARTTDAAAAAYALTEALHRHRVLVLPGQHLNHADLLAVASLVGTVDTATDRRYTVPGFPGLTVVSNIHQGGTPIGIYDGDQEEEWHADNSFKPELTAATLLYSVITAGEGGETRSADATRAYDDLPSGLPARVDDLSAVHSVQHLATRQADAADGRSSTQAGTLAHLPEVTHPLAPVHPPHRRPLPAARPHGDQRHHHALRTGEPCAAEEAAGSHDQRAVRLHPPLGAGRPGRVGQPRHTPHRLPLRQLPPPSPAVPRRRPIAEPPRSHRRMTRAENTRGAPVAGPRVCP
ncbi:Pentalenolactone F synthase [Streptomyces sp. ADI91-18]|nr:Pentalenolactone F synthase [Streptomyces sp. ADI91-18]